jgi:MFS family permease
VLTGAAGHGGTRSRTLAPRDGAVAWRVAGTLGVTELISWGALIYAFSIFLVPMQQEFGGAQAKITGAWSVSVLVRGVASVPAGAWIDRHGVRLLMTGGSVLGVLALVGWSQARSLPVLYLVFVLLGVANSMVLYEPAFAAVSAWFERKRTEATLLVTVLGGFASTVFLPLTGLLVLRLGWRTALLVLASIVAVGTVLPHAMLLRDRPRVRPAHPDLPGGRRRGGRLAGVRQMLALPAFLWLTAAVLLSQAALVTSNVHLVAFVQERGFSAGLAATIAGGLGLLSVTGRLAVTLAKRRIKLARTSAALVAGQAVAIVPLLILPGVLGLVTFVLLLGAGYGVMTVARAVLLNDYVPADRYARAGGLQAFLITIAQVAAPVGASLLREATGTYVWVFVVVGLCAGSAAGCLLLADRAASRASTEEEVIQVR